jgi:hypothetical protein
MAVVASLTTLPYDTDACTFEAGPASVLDVAYPGSLSVAVAIANAKGKGVLPVQDLPHSTVGYQRSVERIVTFASALGRGNANTERRTEFSLLLVGSRLWSSIQPGPFGFAARPHVPGPMLGRPVVLTDYPVLVEITEGRLNIPDAFKLGLIRIDNDSEGKLVEALLHSMTTTDRRAGRGTTAFVRKLSKSAWIAPTTED